MADATAESPALIRALTELDIALEELQGHITLPEEYARRALWNLEADQVQLERLTAMAVRRRSEVDVFEVLALDGSEEFHSNFLAWLLDPGGSHGLSDFVLQEFLRESGDSRAIPAATRPSTTVRRERGVVFDGETGRLDVTILNENSQFICVVENKVWSPESGNQLAFYREALGALYPDYTVRRVFLTPRGEKPDDPGEREHWKTMSYTNILHVIERTIRDKGDCINEDVSALLRQYAVTLRRNIVPEVSNDVHELARRIYRKHKQAIDLIIEHRGRYEPNYVTEGFRMIRDAIQTHASWKEGTTNHPYVRFVSADWNGYNRLDVGSWPYGLLHFEVQVTDHWTGLFLFFSKRGDKKLKRMIYDRVAAIPDIFEGQVSSYSDDYIRLRLSKDILEEHDYENWWDEREIRKTIAGRLDEFANDQFPVINEVVVECLEGYHAGAG